MTACPHCGATIYATTSDRPGQAGYYLAWERPKAVPIMVQLWKDGTVLTFQGRADMGDFIKWQKIEIYDEPVL
jgi:hypothetical protein